MSQRPQPQLGRRASAMGSGLEYYAESEIGGHPVWPLWIEEGEEPKTKAIHRLRRLRRFVKDKARHKGGSSVGWQPAPARTYLHKQKDHRSERPCTLG